jgi:hypothetical protein
MKRAGRHSERRMTTRNSIIVVSPKWPVAANQHGNFILESS